MCLSLACRCYKRGRAHTLALEQNLRSSNEVYLKRALACAQILFLLIVDLGIFRRRFCLSWLSSPSPLYYRTCRSYASINRTIIDMQHVCSYYMICIKERSLTQACSYAQTEWWSSPHGTGSYVRCLCHVLRVVAIVVKSLYSMLTLVYNTGIMCL